MLDFLWRHSLVFRDDGQIVDDALCKYCLFGVEGRKVLELIRIARVAVVGTVEIEVANLKIRIQRLPVMLLLVK